MGINNIFDVAQILDFSRIDLENFLISESEDTSDDAEYYQAGLF